MFEIKRLYIEDVRKHKETIERFIYESVKNAAYEESYEQEDAKKKYSELIEYLKKGKAIIFGAVSGDDLWGFLWAYEYPFRDDKSRLYVSVLHVDQCYRGQNCGKNLLAALEREGEKRGMSSVYLHTEASNKGAIRFYNQAGYQTERIQLVKQVGNSKEKKIIGGVKKITYEILISNKERFIDLFLLNTKAHIFTDSFDRTWAAEKVTDLEGYLLNGQAVVFGFFANDILEGFIWGFPYSYRGKNCHMINAVVVSAEYRRKHVAESLFDKFESDLKEEKHNLYTYVDRANKPAYLFYLKCGMIEDNCQMAKILK